MKTFKSFLKEDTAGNVRLRIAFDYKKRVGIHVSESLREYLEQTYHSSDYHIFVNNEWSFGLYINIKPEIYSRRSKIKAIIKTFTDKVKELEAKIQFPIVSINLTEISEHEVDWDTVTINPTSNITLKNIHKVLQKSKEVNIYKTYNIKGNVLGLLELPGTFNLFDLDKWARIVIQHRGERDILSCKEELINAGLKEYAKF